MRPVLMLHRLTQQPGLLPPCSPALPLLPLTPVHLLVHANGMSTNPYMDLHSPSPSPVDTIDSVSSIETDDSAVTLSDTAPDDEHDFACIYLAHWPAQSPSADSDAWWRPLRLHEARHHNYLRNLRRRWTWTALLVASFDATIFFSQWFEAATEKGAQCNS